MFVFGSEYKSSISSKKKRFGILICLNWYTFQLFDVMVHLRWIEDKDNAIFFCTVKFNGISMAVVLKKKRVSKQSFARVVISNDWRSYLFVFLHIFVDKYASCLCSSKTSVFYESMFFIWTKSSWKSHMDLFEITFLPFTSVLLISGLELKNECK